MKEKIVQIIMEQLMNQTFEYDESVKIAADELWEKNREKFMDFYNNVAGAAAVEILATLNIADN